MSEQVLLRDLVVIPDAVHAGDLVLSLSKGVGEKSTITSYVVTEPLAHNFDRALGLIKSAVETNAFRAAYLDGLVRLRQEPFHGRVARDPVRRPRRAW